MTLADLFKELGAPVEISPPDGGAARISSLCVDSREATSGALFAALPGAQLDGADFAAQAVERGAAAVLSERPLDLPVPNVVAKDARRAFAYAAAAFHGEPSHHLALYGVTGTNGKTTTAYLVEQLAAARGLSTGLIGTVEARWPGGAQKATHTTPESHELQALLHRMRDAGARLVSMEVSSHALAQSRAAACRFAGAAFTNLTRDHLDYHGTLERYFEAKAVLFRELLHDGAPAVLNLDDARVAALAPELRRARRAQVLGFTARGAKGAALAAEDIQSTLEGLRFELRLSAPLDTQTLPVQSPLIGAHNVENLLAALGLLLGGGMSAPELAAAIPQAHGAPGRLERVSDARGRVVLVDYAHTDDALARVLDALRAAAGKGPRLLCVFGCGGDRDKGKRPLMGEAAGARADLIIATSDNPRSEDPLSILAGIEPGLLKSGKRRLGASDARAHRDGFCVVPDRRDAIALALTCARPGDAVLIAGKGHEDYQMVGKEKRPFDDRIEARRVLGEPA